MDFKEVYYPETRFGGFTVADGTIALYTRVNALLDRDAVLLDVGCGRGAYGEDPVAYRRDLRIFKGKCKKVIGMDVDSNASSNPFLDEFRLLDINARQWPIESESVDFCISDFVIEHVEDPDNFMSELNRVLRKGGHFCLRTPNVFSYFGLASILVPNRFHTKVVKKVQSAEDRKEEDVFPVYNRCNTVWSMRRILRKYKFDAHVYTHDAEPTYLSFSRIFYYIGVLHQRFAPSWFKLNIYVFGRKT